MLYKIKNFSECSSTMDLARQHLEEMTDFPNEPIIFQSNLQTKGRGKPGSIWHSKKGNLYCTILIQIPDFRYSNDLSILTAIAVGQSILKLNTHCNLGYKWPNDVYINNKKVSGILIETAHKFDKTWALVGVGINIKHFPRLEKEKTYKATSFLAENIQTDIPTFINILIVELLNLYHHWIELGFTYLHPLWMKRAKGLGSTLEIHQKNRILKGVFKGLDLNGGLIIEKEDGTNDHLFSGDVHII